MKWSDLFKKINLNLDDEVTLDEVENHEEKEEKVESHENKEEKHEEEKKMVFPKRDKNGLFDLTDIEDADMKAYFKELNNDRKNELALRKADADKEVINKSLDESISKLKLSKGITKEAVTKLLDLKDVKVGEDGKVTGIEEALKTLQTSQSGLFIANKETSNPMLEGFNPANGVPQNYVPSTFTEAFALAGDTI